MKLVAPNPALGADGGYLLSIKESTITSQFTSIRILCSTPTTISYSYGSPSGNIPDQNGNGVALWQGQEPVFGPKNPLETTAVPSSDSSGEPSWSLTGGLQMKDYVIAYSTDGSAHTAVATSRINPDGTPGEYFSSIICMGPINTGSAVVGYSFPPGYRPKDFKNRLGLYEGQCGAYNLPDTGEMTLFPRDDNSGHIAINHSFLRSTWYTIVYFAGVRAEDAAGFVRFQTA